ncbi:LacI family transcriptional regulator, sucrose operon repressor [Evansella caseinilytica]|uniref:LacI family transcriptional regulator, sucrose operon repressor n=1 Tax=Evansella caseinilytica TaxID=1503961 RepID=A0A1H3SDG6_9BACI|nr:LacI family DNA-binding transcriptional regulator [Evansella caseinilytica]SDZ35748.1 LacI family transcriptional regulator, sucrose operon repressor [Evansella caseinilytica]
MKPKISDVAKLAGVSPTTVSRILNNRGYIGEETRQKVYEAMEELNYVPNDLARALYNKKTFLIGVIVPTTAKPFFGQLVSSIEHHLEKSGYRMMLCNNQNRVDKEKDYIKMLQRNQVDGIIIGTHNDVGLNYNDLTLPIVSIDRNLSKTIPVITSDNYEGGKKATEYLLEQGCKKIIHVHPKLSDKIQTPLRRRGEAYRDTMAANNHIPMYYEMNILGNQQHLKYAVHEFFNAHPEVDGVFASDDLLAAALLSEATKRGIHVPDDLRVVGYDGTEIIRLCLPALPTVKQPIELIAETAITTLLSLINEEKRFIDSEIILPIEFFRNS